MNPDQQRIAIAESCGWLRGHACKTCGHGGDQWLTPERTIKIAIPDYLNDLNAMDEAENFMKTWSESDSKAYRDYISVLRALVPGYPESATASQRAEAFLRTIGKWTE